MKIRILIPTIVICLGITFLSANSTFAISQKRIWTIPELIDMKIIADREMDELCNGDRTCERELRASRLEDGEKRAVSNFSDMVLMITAINPSNSTIKVLFHDEDQMARRFFGTRQYAILDELHVAWFSSQPDMYNSYYAVHGNYPEGMYHPLFAGSASINGSNWLTPNIEIELSINDAESLYDLPHTIYFTMEADLTNVSGVHDYSDCMDSPDYEIGMECRMVFDDEGGFFFLPFLPGTDTPVRGQELDPEILADPEPTDETQESLPPSDDNQETRETGEGALELKEDFISTDTTDLTTERIILKNILSPDTGVLSNLTKNHIKADLPWWIIILVILGGALLLWFFASDSKKPPKNS